MSQWEYIYARAQNEKISYVNDQPAGKERAFFGVKGPSVFDFLTKAGQEGWEVVGITQGVSTEWRLILKRPVMS